ncbi:MAG TPA: hypothetical protein VM537_05760 [Anaerolineae bacterium]|nr:hypothetical protein [Anaerolineae bacterium]
MPDRQPWERRKGEGRKAYDAFCSYRDQEDARSLAAVGKVLGKSDALMERWSVRWGWVERAHAWDDHIAAIASDRALDAQLAERAAENAENLRQQAARLAEARALAATARATVNTAAPVALARLKRSLGQVEALIANPEAPANLIDEAIKDAISALHWATKSMEVAHKLEALALGKATDRTAVQLDPASVDRLADIITAHVPEDHWDTVVKEVAATLKGEHVNGRP